MQPNPRPLCPGMPGNVIQRFLQHTVDVDASTSVYGERLALLLIGYGNSGLPFHGGDVPIESALETGLVEHDGMKRLRQSANFVQS